MPRRETEPASIPSSVTAATSIDLPSARADWWPSRVRSRTYSRSLHDIAASTVNTMPDGSWEPCSSPARNSRPMPRPSRLCSCAMIVTAAPDADLPSPGNGLIQLGPGDCPGRDLSGEDHRDACRAASRSGCRATGMTVKARHTPVRTRPRRRAVSTAASPPRSYAAASAGVYRDHPGLHLARRQGRRHRDPRRPPQARGLARVNPAWLAVR